MDTLQSGVMLYKSAATPKGSRPLLRHFERLIVMYDILSHGASKVPQAVDIELQLYLT